MKNIINFDLELLSKQQDAINESNLDKDNKEGLNNLISTILDIAKDNNQKGNVEFVMVLK